MTKVHQVRREFGEPFRDVVRGFAVMGYSRAATANILHFNLSYFRQLCTRFNLHQYFKPQREMRPECRGVGTTRKGWPKGKKRPFRARYTNEYLLGLVARYPIYGDFMSWAPVAASTVTRRFRVPWREIVKMAQQEVFHDSDRNTRATELFPVREDGLRPSPANMPEEARTGRVFPGIYIGQRRGEKEAHVCHVCGL